MIRFFLLFVLVFFVSTLLSLPIVFFLARLDVQVPFGELFSKLSYFFGVFQGLTYFLLRSWGGDFTLRHFKAKARQQIRRRIEYRKSQVVARLIVGVFLSFFLLVVAVFLDKYPDKALLQSSGIAAILMLAYCIVISVIDYNQISRFKASSQTREEDLAANQEAVNRMTK